MAKWFCTPSIIRETCSVTTVMQEQCPLNYQDYAVYIGFAVLVGLVSLTSALYLLAYLEVIEVKDSIAVKAKRDDRPLNDRSRAVSQKESEVNWREESVLIFRDEICTSIDDVRMSLVKELEMELRAVRRGVEVSVREGLLKQSEDLERSYLKLSSSQDMGKSRQPQG
jgi:hypothetical protein